MVGVVLVTGPLSPLIISSALSLNPPVPNEPPRQIPQNGQIISPRSRATLFCPNRSSLTERDSFAYQQAHQYIFGRATADEQTEGWNNPLNINPMEYRRPRIDPNYSRNIRNPPRR